MEEEFKNTIKRDNESGYYSVASFRSEFVLDRAMVNIESKETIGLSQSAKSNNSIAKNLATINEEPRVHRGQQLVKTQCAEQVELDYSIDLSPIRKIAYVEMSILHHADQSSSKKTTIKPNLEPNLNQEPSFEKKMDFFSAKKNQKNSQSSKDRSEDESELEYLNSYMNSVSKLSCYKESDAKDKKGPYTNLHTNRIYPKNEETSLPIRPKFLGTFTNKISTKKDINSLISIQNQSIPEEFKTVTVTVDPRAKYLSSGVTLRTGSNTSEDSDYQTVESESYTKTNEIRESQLSGVMFTDDSNSCGTNIRKIQNHLASIQNPAQNNNKIQSINSSQPDVIFNQTKKYGWNKNSLVNRFESVGRRHEQVPTINGNKIKEGSKWNQLPMYTIHEENKAETVGFDQDVQKRHFQSKHNTQSSNNEKLAIQNKLTNNTRTDQEEESRTSNYKSSLIDSFRSGLQGISLNKNDVNKFKLKPKFFVPNVSKKQNKITKMNLQDNKNTFNEYENQISVPYGSDCLSNSSKKKRSKRPTTLEKYEEVTRKIKQIKSQKKNQVVIEKQQSKINLSTEVNRIDKRVKKIIRKSKNAKKGETISLLEQKSSLEQKSLKQGTVEQSSQKRELTTILSMKSDYLSTYQRNLEIIYQEHDSVKKKPISSFVDEEFFLETDNMKKSKMQQSKGGFKQKYNQYKNTNPFHIDSRISQANQEQEVMQLYKDKDELEEKIENKKKCKIKRKDYF